MCIRPEESRIEPSLLYDYVVLVAEDKLYAALIHREYARGGDCLAAAEDSRVNLKVGELGVAAGTNLDRAAGSGEVLAHGVGVGIVPEFILDVRELARVAPS